MKPSKFTSLALLSVVAACVPQPKPAPVVVTTPAPSPKPLVEAPVAYTNWMDAPRTPGDWHYRRTSSGGIAAYDDPRSGTRFQLECEADNRQIALSVARPAGRNDDAMMKVLTETTSRTLAADASEGWLTTRVPATDRLLDAMALSKGRFAVEVVGTQTLYLPSWAEVTRVIEDCR